MTGRILRTFLAATALFAIAGFSAASAMAVSITTTGPEQTVYDWTTQRCDDTDIPDAPAVAFRDSTNRVQLISASFDTRRMVGPDLDHLTRDCTNLFPSQYDPNPAHFNDWHWLGAPYTENGQDIYVLVHNEYHGWTHPGACQTGSVRRCHFTGITYAVSHDNGDTYQAPAPPDNLVAAAPPRYTSDFGRNGLYGADAPVKLGNYYYSFMIIQTPDPQDTGVCAMRTKDISDPTSWRGWDGTSFSMRFRNPFYENANPVTTHRCEPISRENILQIQRSVTYNTAINKFIVVGNSVLYDPAQSRYVYGFYFSTSDDLVHWSMRQLLMEVVTVTQHVCGGPDPILYPSFIDPNSTDRNFRVSDGDLYLYYIRLHYDELCNQSLDRDVLRIPIHVSP
jgi:hypothetical protein